VADTDIAINPGDVVVLETDPPFTNAANVASDPDQVRLLVRRAGQPPTVFTYGVDDEVVKDATGTYHVDFVIPHAGKYFFRWEGEGGVSAAEESSFTAVTDFA
jgi:hypothetical protein